MRMHAKLRNLEEIHEAVVSSQSHGVEVMQLSAGAATCDMALLSMNGLRLLRTKFSARHRWTDTRTDRALHLSLASHVSKSGGVVNGTAYDAESLFCMSGPAVVTAVSEAEFDSFEVVISEQLAEDLGLPEGMASFLPARRPALDTLRGVLSTALDQTPRDAHHNRRAPVTAENILQAVEGALEAMPSFVADKTTAAHLRERLITHADAIMNDWDPEARLEVEDLSRNLGVARRTLHHAFRLNLGLGPTAFYRLKKLHAVRAVLLAAEPDETSIADVAHAHGFFEAGRMAGQYRDLFGELPRQTLARHRET